MEANSAGSAWHMRLAVRVGVLAHSGGKEAVRPRKLTPTTLALGLRGVAMMHRRSARVRDGQRCVTERVDGGCGKEFAMHWGDPVHAGRVRGASVGGRVVVVVGFVVLCDGGGGPYLCLIT